MPLHVHRPCRCSGFTRRPGRRGNRREIIQCERSIAIRGERRARFARWLGIAPVDRSSSPQLSEAPCLTKPVHHVDLLERIRRAATIALPKAEPVPTLEALERDTIWRALERADGRVREAASALKIPRSTLYARIAALGLKSYRGGPRGGPSARS